MKKLDFLGIPTCALVGNKVYIPEDSDTVLEIYDTVTGAVKTIANACGQRGKHGTGKERQRNR